jgi:hypothetical protein
MYKNLAQHKEKTLGRQTIRTCLKLAAYFIATLRGVYR